MSEVCVIHLIWYPFGIEPFRQFIETYRRFNAGIPHKLILLFNGFPEGAPRDAYLALMEGISCEVFDTRASLQDIPAYYLVAGARTEKYLCMLNSYSQIRGENWLGHMIRCLTMPGIGLVGPTGSWESFLTNNIRQISLAAANARVLLTEEMLRRNIQPFAWDLPHFPNPHVRSSCFVMSREMFLGLPFKPGNDKGECYRFESGRSGMTFQLRGRNLDVLVCGRDGTAYHCNDWPSSRTFRSGNQENLLISDKHSRLYDAAGPEQRQLLSAAAWGV